MKPSSNLTKLRLSKLMKQRRKDTVDENHVEKLLQPVKKLDLIKTDYDSDVSEISDVFEEFHKNSHLRPQANKRYLTKHEADVKTVEEFSSDFKKTMASLREDLNFGDKDLFLEDVQEIEKIFESPRDPQIFPKISVGKEISELLDGDSIPSPESLKKARKLSDTSSSSLVWHMLAVNSDNKKFEISPPGFDTFRQEKPHWLQRASVSWGDIDQATLKCENWLQQHCHQLQNIK